MLFTAGCASAPSVAAEPSAQVVTPAVTPEPPVEAGLIVNKIEGLSNDFIMGADVSSLISLENSGVTY